jgi:predicted kinase
MIYWINGHTDRFKALVVHDGNIAERLAYYNTEELWFPEWEHGGVPWEKPAGYTSQSPIDLCKKLENPNTGDSWWPRLSSRRNPRHGNIHSVATQRCREKICPFSRREPLDSKAAEFETLASRSAVVDFELREIVRLPTATTGSTMQVPVLHFLCGKAGAGKSTLANSIASQACATLISEDIWLSRLFADQLRTFDDYRMLALRLKSVVGPLAVDLLQSGRSIVFDFPANTKTTRAWFRSIFEQAKSDHLLHFLDTPNDVCLQRIEKRNVERPEGSHVLSVEDFHHISSYFQVPDDDEKFNIRWYRPEHVNARI